MNFTKEKLSEQMCKHAEKENGLLDFVFIELRREYSPFGVFLFAYILRQC